MSPALIVAVVIIGLLFLLSMRRRPSAPRAVWGVWPEADRDLNAIARYFRARAGSDARSSVDDRTWADLDMDGVFTVIDRAETLVGQQVLYARLRTPTGPEPEEVSPFEALVTGFERDPAVRGIAQSALAGMRRVDARDLWWLVQPGNFEAARWHVVFPVAGATMATTAMLAFAYPGLILVLAAGAIGSIVLRATAARHIRIVGATLRQVGPLLAAADHLRALHRSEVTTIVGPLVADLPKLARLRRAASWAGRESTGAMAGDVASVMIEYLNLLLCLDGNAVFFGARDVHAHGAELLRVAHAIGEIDAALSVASYRTGTVGWTRPTFTTSGQAAVLDQVRHPLLPEAVPNTLQMYPRQGTIITGSNMSGKTTFLRTIGVAAVLARTINTCLAASYAAPAFTVRTCIGRSDDPASGRSYYLVEVEAVLGLVAAARETTPTLFLFDELFRGTNTIERVAAGEAVLVALLAPADDGSPSPHVVVAATHDQELVELLADTYDASHFSDAVADSGLVFDYQLRAGPATTRNAIAMLRQRGAPAALVARAEARAISLGAGRGR